MSETKEIRADLWHAMSIEDLSVQQRLLDDRLVLAYQCNPSMVASIYEAQRYLCNIITDRTTKR